MIHPLYAVLREAVGPNIKTVAQDVWPESTPETARANLTKVLQGNGNIPAALFDIALQKPGMVLLRYCEEKAKADPAQLRQKALARLESIEAALSAVREELGDADEQEEFAARLKPIPARTPSRRAG